MFESRLMTAVLQHKVCDDCYSNDSKDFLFVCEDNEAHLHLCCGPSNTDEGLD